MSRPFLSKIVGVVAFPLFLCFFTKTQAQSIELMVGEKRVFADLQWLRFMDKNRHWSVFSRTRATVDYNNQSDLFSGAYLNFTVKNGFGASLVGRIGASGAGADAGLHFFKAKKNWMLFALASYALQQEPQASWFSIVRYTPELNEQWRLYSSLELFTVLGDTGHQFSVQRIRIGLDKKGYQFGLGNNLSETGRAPVYFNNFGVFFRKNFN